MQDRAEQAVEMLKKAKNDQLTFHEASQLLINHGFSEVEVTRASYNFPFSEPITNANMQPTVNYTKDHPSEQLVDLGSSILQDKEKGTRPYVYLLAIPVAGLAMQIYDFYLSRRFWDSGGDGKYLWFNNVVPMLAIGGITAIGVIVWVRFSFKRKDKSYARDK